MAIDREIVMGGDSSFRSLPLRSSAKGTSPRAIDKVTPSSSMPPMLPVKTYLRNVQGSRQYDPFIPSSSHFYPYGIIHPQPTSWLLFPNQIWSSLPLVHFLPQNQPNQIWINPIGKFSQSKRTEKKGISGKRKRGPKKGNGHRGEPLGKESRRRIKYGPRLKFSSGFHIKNLKSSHARLKNYKLKDKKTYRLPAKKSTKRTKTNSHPINEVPEIFLRKPIKVIDGDTLADGAKHNHRYFRIKPNNRDSSHSLLELKPENTHIEEDYHYNDLDLPHIIDGHFPEDHYDHHHHWDLNYDDWHLDHIDQQVFNGKMRDENADTKPRANPSPKKSPRRKFKKIKKPTPQTPIRKAFKSSSAPPPEPIKIRMSGAMGFTNWVHEPVRFGERISFPSGVRRNHEPNVAANVHNESSARSPDHSDSHHSRQNFYWPSSRPTITYAHSVDDHNHQENSFSKREYARMPMDVDDDIDPPLEPLIPASIPAPDDLVNRQEYSPHDESLPSRRKEDDGLHEHAFGYLNTPPRENYHPIPVYSQSDYHKNDEHGFSYNENHENASSPFNLAGSRAMEDEELLPKSGLTKRKLLLPNASGESSTGIPDEGNEINYQKEAPYTPYQYTISIRWKNTTSEKVAPFDELTPIGTHMDSNNLSNKEESEVDENSDHPISDKMAFERKSYRKFDHRESEMWHEKGWMITSPAEDTNVESKSSLSDKEEEGDGPSLPSKSFRINERFTKWAKRPIKMGKHSNEYVDKK